MDISAFAFSAKVKYIGETGPDCITMLCILPRVNDKKTPFGILQSNQVLGYHHLGLHLRLVQCTFMPQRDGVFLHPLPHRDT